MNGPLVENGYCTMSESLTFESKRCENKLPRSFWETYSAFANTSGGTIVLGFTETSGRLKLTGVTEPKKVITELWDLLHNRNKVSLNLLKEDDVRLEEYEELAYIVISIPRADRHMRPVYIDNDLDSGTFRRNNSGDYHCSVHEIMEMGRDASESSMDQRIVTGSSPEWVDEDTLESYRACIRAHDPGHPWAKEEDEELLRLIGAADYSEGKLMLTQAGLVMFGRITEIVRTIPGYNLRYRESEGRDWTDVMNSDSGTWTGNVFDFYQTVSRKLFQSNKHPFALKEGIRVDDTDLIKIQREALLNALVHADYQGSGGITAGFDGKTFTVINPGCFRIPLEKAMKGGYSDARNPAMMRMFALAGLVERQGSGILRMIDVCRENLLPMPEFSEETDPSLVRLTIRLDRGDVPLDGMVIALMKEQPKVSIDRMTEMLGVTRHAVVSTVDRLKSEGRIRRDGGRKGSWTIIESDR